MTLDEKAKHEILDLTVEDWTPLYDVTNVVKVNLPNQCVDEQIDVARAFVRYLLARNFVKLYYDCWATSTENFRDTKELSSIEVEREMYDRTNWLYHEPREPDERCVTIGATTDGENAVYRCEFPTD